MPVVALPPVTPLTCHVTAVFVATVLFASVTVAVKVACVFKGTLAVVGDIAIEEILPWDPLPQPITAAMQKNRTHKNQWEPAAPRVLISGFSRKYFGAPESQLARNRTGIDSAGAANT